MMIIVLCVQDILICLLRQALLKKRVEKFGTIAPELLARIDSKRCINEIPLIDTETNQVWYGTDALLEILQQKIPFARPVGNIRILKYFLTKLYKFISYNRRVIVAAKRTQGNFDCTPEFNIPYRFAFMAVFLLVNTLMLFPLQQYVLKESIFNARSIQQLQLAHAILIMLNIFIAVSLNKYRGIEYLGQVNMLAVEIILLTIPLIVINKYTALHNGFLNSFYLGAISVFAIQEYARRMRFINFIKEYPLIIFTNSISVVVFIIYLIR